MDLLRTSRHLAALGALLMSVGCGQADAPRGAMDASTDGSKTTDAGTSSRRPTPDASTDATHEATTDGGTTAEGSTGSSDGPLTGGQGVPSQCDYTYYAAGNTTPLQMPLTVIAAGPSSLTPENWMPMLGATTMFMLEIVVPNPSASTKHTLEWAEYIGPPTSRVVYASKTPCDMQKASLVAAAQSGSITLRIGAGSGAVKMLPGETWYIMIVDYSLDGTRGSVTAGLPTKNSCPVSTGCEAIVVLQ
jgi:hypothetical protein